MLKFESNQQMTILAKLNNCKTDVISSLMDDYAFKNKMDTVTPDMLFELFSRETSVPLDIIKTDESLSAFRELYMGVLDTLKICQMYMTMFAEIPYSLAAESLSVALECWLMTGATNLDRFKELAYNEVLVALTPKVQDVIQNNLIGYYIDSDKFITIKIALETILPNIEVICDVTSVTLTLSLLDKRVSERFRIIHVH